MSGPREAMIGFHKAMIGFREAMSGIRVPRHHGPK